MHETVGLIGGSGLGDVLEGRLERVEYLSVDTPFGKPSGKILKGTFGGREVIFINRHGDGHRFSPSAVPYAANIFALKSLGATAVIAGGAVGSLKESFKPKDIVIVSQVIDKTFTRKKSFFDDIAAVHCEMAAPYCDRLRGLLARAGEKISADVHSDAAYVCMEGPQFSTRAESLMHQSWGAELIGMTGMPEAKLAREAQMCFALVALVSDYDCWREPEQVKEPQALLAEIIGNLSAAADNAAALIETALKSDTPLCDQGCACRESLKLAVWTKPELIDERGKEVFDVLRR